MSKIALVGVDWGSTSARAFRIAPDGGIIDVRRAEDGVFAGHDSFDKRLRSLIGEWLPSEDPPPILLCGMIGSDRGWVHAPYVAAPSGLDDLARGLVFAPFDGAACIVPGVSLVVGETCEVMRGEETLLMGLAAQESRRTVCLPGTHSKWVDLIDGRIVAFRTCMTGEMRALLLGGGTLAPQVPQVPSRREFLNGLVASREAGALATRLFQARARRLLGNLAAEHVAAFVSGILIGDEIERQVSNATRREPIVLVARGVLAEDYSVALKLAGQPFNTVDPETLAAAGLLKIAVCAGLVEGGTM